VNVLPERVFVAMQVLVHAKLDEGHWRLVCIPKSFFQQFSYTHSLQFPL